MKATASEAVSAQLHEGAFSGTSLGAFVRDSYAEDCLRFIAELKRRLALPASAA